MQIDPAMNGGDELEPLNSHELRPAPPPAALGEGLAWSEDGNLVPITEPDTAALIDGLGDWGKPLTDNSPMSISDAFKVFAEIETYMLVWESSAQPQTAHNIGMRAIAKLFVLRPDLLDDDRRTLQQIADKEGCTKANVCALTLKFRDAFAQKCRSMRSDVARATMSAAGFLRSLKAKRNGGACADESITTAE